MALSSLESILVDSEEVGAEVLARIPSILNVLSRVLVKESSSKNVNEGLVMTVAEICLNIV